MNNIIQKIRGNKYWQFLLLLLVNTGIFVIMAEVLPVRFEENDDTIMCLIANGRYSGTPDCHLVYINALYGCILAALYKLTTAIEWYALSFSALHIFSLTVLVYCMWHLPKRSRHTRYIWILFLYIFWARIIMGLQFTTTAGLLCAAGCMLLLRRSPLSTWIGVACVVIASLVRYQAAALVGLLFAPVIIYNIQKEWKRYIPLTVMVVLVIGARFAHEQFYNQPEWRTYRQYNTIRAKLNDNPNAYRPAVLEHLPEGISPVDYKLLLAFNGDAEVMNLDVIKQIYEYVDSRPVEKKMQNLKRLYTYLGLLLLLGVMFIVLIITHHKSKRMQLLLAGYILFFISLMIGVSLDGFLKERVFLCFMLPAILTNYLMISNSITLRHQIMLSYVVVAICTLEVCNIHQRTKDDEYHRVLWTYYQKPLVDQLPSDARILTLGTNMHMEFMDPYHLADFPVQKCALGWCTNIPFNKGICDNFKQLTDERMYLFVPIDYTEPTNAAIIVQGRIKEDYGIDTDIVSFAENNRYAIVQFKKKN